MESFTVPGLSLLIARMLPEPHAGLLTGLLFGTKAQLPRALYDALVATGTIHIIALSGMNISILSRMVTLSVSRVTGVRWATAVSFVAIGWFTWFVGAGPSIVRAAVMGSIASGALLLGKSYVPIVSWAIAAGGMMSIHPAWATDISFQLSAAATLGIILYGPQGDESLATRHAQDCRDEKGPVEVHETHAGAWFWQTLRDDLHTTLAAQVFTVPIILWYFHRISLIAPVANVLIGWTIAPLTVLGWVTVAAGWIWRDAGQIVAWISWVFLEYLIRTVQIVSTIPGISWGW